jgi:hypothetical protein
MGIDKANFLIQKSHLQDWKIQISQSLFAIWMAFLLSSNQILAYKIFDSAQEGFPYLWVNGEKYVFS